MLVAEETRPPLRVNRGARRDRPRRDRDRRGDGRCTAGRGAAARRGSRRAPRGGRRTRCSRRPASQGWQLAARARAGARARACRVHRRLARRSTTRASAGALRGYPYEPAAVERIAALARSATSSRACRAALRSRVLARDPEEIAVAGRVRRAALRRARGGAAARRSSCAARQLDEPLDAIVIGVPRDDAVPAARAPEPAARRLPRPRPRAAPLARRVPGASRAAPRSSSTSSSGSSPHPTQQPYRAFFHAARGGRDPQVLADAERAAAPTTRAPLEEYRAGRTVPPAAPVRRLERLPAGARPPRRRLRRRRRATRPSPAQLGFVPAHGVGAALRYRPRPRRRRRRGSASCSRRRTSRSGSAAPT